MMLKLNEVAILFCICFLPSCAQIIPESTDQNLGLIAIPMEASNAVSDYDFMWHYKLEGTAPNDINIEAIPAIGKDFIFSALVSPGQYIMDWIIGVSPHDFRASTKINKFKEYLPEAIIVNVEPGKITIANVVFKVTQFNLGAETFAQNYEILKLDKQKKEEYITKLYELENSEVWDVSPN